MFTVVESWHPEASVTTTVYVPAGMAVAVLPVCTGDVFHEYVKGLTPPEALTDAWPSDCPQFASIPELVKEIAVGSITV
jgi:hypothetical protein